MICRCYSFWHYNLSSHVVRFVLVMIQWHNAVAQTHGPHTRYAKLRVAHSPGMPGTFSPLLRFSDPAMHHGRCVTHVPWCMSGSLTSGFLWSQGKRSRHSRRMHNQQFYVSGKRPICIYAYNEWNHLGEGNFTPHFIRHVIIYPCQEVKPC